MQSTETWISRVNSNQSLNKRGDWITLAFTFGIEDTDLLINIINGKINSIKKRTLLTESGVFRIHGSKKCWEKHWLKVPPRDFHDIFSMNFSMIFFQSYFLIILFQCEFANDVFSILFVRQ